MKKWGKIRAFFYPKFLYMKFGEQNTFKTRHLKNKLPFKLSKNLRWAPALALGAVAAAG